MPHAIPITRHHGMDAIELVAPDGARATVLLHGAHILSWTPAGGVEQLYLSPQSEFTSGQAIRGGVPVVFPQFSSRGPLQKHGFARNKPWQLVSAEQGADDALAVLRLADDAATRMVWPHAFELELSVRVSGNGLEIELACENKGGADDAPFDFNAALHTYFALDDLESASISGLSGLSYFDSVAKQEKRQRTDLLLPGAVGLDCIYHRIVEGPQDLTLSEANRSVLISQQGFDDTVVWNPGSAGITQIADLPDADWRRMICVEAAAIERAIRLAPGESWAGMQTLSVPSSLA